MNDIETKIEEIIIKYEDEYYDCVSPCYYDDDDNETEHYLAEELEEFLESQKISGNIKDYSFKNKWVVESCGRDAGVYSIAFVYNNGELYHQVIEWDVC